jgi:gas vesicle protein
MAGLVVGGLVGAALALLYRPRAGHGVADTRLMRAGGLGGDSAESLLERSRDALRARFSQAAAEAERAARETEERLQSEYRGTRDSG